ncbi:hypothetical protein F4677DRAFT_465882 [Hypoxylon crocopeplum]|nr:hypothetical protein F4677DRAFT_465882 [Hypoxylon crocopeplum]
MSTQTLITLEDIEYWARDNPNNGYPYPLHDVGLSLAPVVLRLAWAEEALASGHDVNKLHARMGRPLHAAIENPQNIDDRTRAVLGRYENVDLVKWLLDHDADPRLRDLQGKSPMDEALCQSRYHKEKGSSVAEFWDQARQMMIQAGKKLEKKEVVEGGIVYRIKAFFSIGRDPKDNMCVFCRLGYFGHQEGQWLKKCQYCKEEKVHKWHYKPAVSWSNKGEQS